jgi:hypothetical protein
VTVKPDCCRLGTAMQLSRQRETCTFSTQAERLFECLWGRDRCLAGEIAAHVGSGVPVYESSVLKERNRSGLHVGCPQRRHLEGVVALANDAQAEEPVADHLPGVEVHLGQLRVVIKRSLKVGCTIQYV